VAGFSAGSQHTRHRRQPYLRGGPIVGGHRGDPDSTDYFLSTELEHEEVVADPE